jgi:hypothetical protein
MNTCHVDNAPVLTTETKGAVASATVLTLIDRKDRTLKVSFPVDDRKSAFALYREIGTGCDARISGPMYDQLILGLDSANLNKFLAII